MKEEEDKDKEGSKDEDESKKKVFKISMEDVYHTASQAIKLKILRWSMRSAIKRKDWINLYDCIEELKSVEIKIGESNPTYPQEMADEILDTELAEMVKRGLSIESDFRVME